MQRGVTQQVLEWSAGGYTFGSADRPLRGREGRPEQQPEAEQKPRDLHQAERNCHHFPWHSVLLS